MDRTPPHSIESEQSVIGGILINPSAIDDVMDILDPGMFYQKDNEIIYRAIMEMADSGQEPDVFTLTEHLKERGLAEEVGGLSYIARLQNDTPGSSNIVSYARTVESRHIERTIAEMALGLEDIIYGTEPDKADRSMSMVSQMLESAEKKGSAIYLPDALSALVDTIEKRFESDGSMLGISSGFDEYDESTSGLCEGDLVIVAGRPSMGKSTFAMNVAANVAKDHCTQVFSLEMPASQLIERTLASEGRIPLKAIRNGNLQDDHWPRISATIGDKMPRLNMHIDDRAGIGINDIKAVCRRMKRKHKLRLVVIDYLQIMDMGKGDNETQQLGKITGQLKILAKNLGITIILLSQLNRSLENRPNKRPIMSDLRQSGKIEEDADVVAFLYRDEVYDENTEYKGQAELIKRKVRNGDPGTSYLKFEGWCTKFSSLDYRSSG